MFCESCGVWGWARHLGIHLRQTPVSSRPSGGPREAGGPGVGLRGGGGCDRRALVLPSGGGGGAHVPIPSAKGPADDPEIVSTGHSGDSRAKLGTKRRRAGGPELRRERGDRGLTPGGLWATGGQSLSEGAWGLNHRWTREKPTARVQVRPTCLSPTKRTLAQVHVLACSLWSHTATCSHPLTLAGQRSAHTLSPLTEAQPGLARLRRAPTTPSS